VNIFTINALGQNMKKFGIVIFGAQLLLLPAAGFGQAVLEKLLSLK